LTFLHIQGAAQLAGCERSCQVLIKQLKCAHHRVVVIGPDGPAVQAWKQSGAEVQVLDLGWSRHREFNALRRLIAVSGADGVILWTSSRLGLKIAACQAGGARRIVAHVGNPIRLAFRNSVAAELYTLLPRARQASLVAVSRHVARSYSGKSGFRHFRTNIVYNAIDTGHFLWDPLDGVPDNARVGMVARLDSIKDHATLLRGWQLVAKARPNWQLELAGDGPLREPLQALASSLHISGSVNFLGWVKDVPQTMRRWSAVVHSTTAQEGLGNSMLEAMAMGRPLVATNVGPIAEVTDEGRVARLTRPGDHAGLAAQILQVAQEPARTRELMVSAQQWVTDRFSPQEMVTGYLRCLGLGGPD